jgi:hypothetical protein
LTVEAQSRDSGSPVDARALRAWSEQLCRLPPDVGGAEVAAALGIAGSVVEHSQDFTFEPPPARTRKVELVKHPIGFDYLEIYLSGRTLTRAQLDAHFGDSRELPRVHWDSPRTIAYDVEVPGAPFKCAVVASFAEEPKAGAAANRVVLRRDRVYGGEEAV